MSREKRGTKGSCPECNQGIPAYGCSYCGAYDIPEDHECEMDSLFQVIDRQRGNSHLDAKRMAELQQENADLSRALDILLTKYALRGY